MMMICCTISQYYYYLLNLYAVQLSMIWGSLQQSNRDYHKMMMMMQYFVIELSQNFGSWLERLWEAGRRGRVQ